MKPAIISRSSRNLLYDPSRKRSTPNALIISTVCPVITSPAMVTPVIALNSKPVALCPVASVTFSHSGVLNEIYTLAKKDVLQGRGRLPEGKDLTLHRRWYISLRNYHAYRLRDYKLYWLRGYAPTPLRPQWTPAPMWGDRESAPPARVW